MKKRPRILVSMLPEPGHILPTLRISRTLERRGVDIRYLAIPDVEGTIRSQGFETVRHLDDLFPLGVIEADQRLGRLELRRTRTARFEAMTRAFLGEEVRATILRQAPDLMLIDVCDSLMAFLARKLRIPAVAVSTALPQTFDPGVPPSRSRQRFRPGIIGRASAFMAWAKFIGQRRLGARLAATLGMAPPYDLARRAVPRFGSRLRDATVDPDTTYMPQVLDMTELVLCPEAFDFPRPPRPRRHYVESFDEARRGAAEFSWDAIDPTKPLVYCSMSSQRFRSGDVIELFRLVIDLFRRESEWQLILSLGPHASREVLGPIPRNAVVVSRAPQLEILSKARVIVTHGGLGSLKEAIMSGVVPVCFPLDVDQEGNAARVEHHGIGVRGEIARATVEELSQLVRAALTEPGLRSNLEAMRREFQRVESADTGADLIENALAHPPIGR